MLTPEIIKAVAVTAELTGARLSEGAVEVMVEHLSGYDTAQVLAALHRCQLELRGPLTLGAIMDRLDDGHLGPESAWALVGGLREDDSVVWTEEIAQAYGGVLGLLPDDPIAARMAFLETYRGLLGTARSQRRAPVWMPSLGFNAAARVAALGAAVATGRLTVEVAGRNLPRHEWPREWNPRPMLTEGRPAPAEVRALVDAVLTKKTLPGAGT